MQKQVMRTKMLTGLLLICHMTFVSLVTAFSVDDDTQQQVDPAVLTEALREMFGLHHIPASSSAGVQGHLTGDGGDAANYLMTLYDRVKDGASLNYKHNPANTVRAILPTTEIIDGQLMYIFNVSKFVSHEHVFGGELHVMRKKAGLRRHVAIQMSSLGCPSLDLEPLRPVNQTDAWHVFDVTRELQTCLDRASHRRYGGTGINLLTLTSFFLGSALDDQQATPISGRKVTRYLSKPFLVVYLNESQTITQDHVQPRLARPEGAADASVVAMGDGTEDGGAFYNPETGTLEFYGTGAARMVEDDGMLSDEGQPPPPPPPASRSLADVISNSTRKVADYDTDDSTWIVRKRRSTLDNEIPEIPETFPPSLQHNHPSGAGYSNPVTGSSKQKIYHPPYPEQKPKGRQRQQQQQQDSQASAERDSSFIPYPPDYQGQGRGGSQNKKARKGKKKQLFQSPAPWKPGSGHNLGDNDATNGLDDLCARRRLVIDFADIGWSEWMISPRSFDAHYCAGSCPFPIPQRLRPSNHATIQSLVSALGVYPGVPGPCCVPDTMTSVTLLYFDDNKNVVLKNYPAMSVKTCACK